MFKKCLGYSLISIMLSNMSAGLVSFLLTASTVYTGAVLAETVESNTPRLDELKAKYDLENPNRNGKKGGVYPNLEDKFDQKPRDLTDIIKNMTENAPESREIDLDGKGNNKTQGEMVQESNALGRSIGLKVGRPVLNDKGGVQAEYTRKATRQYYRDKETDDLQHKVVEDAGKDRVTDLGSEDFLSAEKDNEEYDFKANQFHGKDSEIKQDGLKNHNSLRKGTNSAARGYQAITSGASRANNTVITEDAAWLKPGFNALVDTEKNIKEDFFKSCQNVDVKKNKDIHYNLSTDYNCMDTGQANFDRCEVERKIRVPILAEGTELKSCGPGCYEYMLNVEGWKTSHCRSTPADASPAVLKFNLNFDDNVVIKRVSLKGSADDHFKFTVNGKGVWESNVNTQGPTGNWQAGKCNNPAHSPIDADITSSFLSIVGPQTGTKAVEIRADIRWKRNGGMEVMFRIELDDTSGKFFKSEFIQTPAGCYDALRQIDKRNRGLKGVYNWQEVGVSYVSGGNNYSCQSPSQTPLCNAGETLFGTVTKEQCLSAPVYAAPTCDIGTYDATAGACYHPATLKEKNQPTDPDVYHCPTAGILEGNKCKTPSTATPPCQAGRNLKMVKVNGVESEYCSGSPIGLGAHQWSCSSSEGFDAARCSVSLETFEDPNGSIVKTYTDDGFKIDPVYDSEGDLVEFIDQAYCTSTGTDSFEQQPEPESFCSFDSYQNILTGDGGFPTSTLDRIPVWYDGDTGNKTWKVNLKGYRCDPTQGQIMCRTNPETGEEECKPWEYFQDLSPRCDKYLKDTNCREISRKCPDGWKEEISGRCMSEVVTFRCDTEKTASFETVETTNTCTAAIPCAGGDDCFATDTESNEKFVEATVAANILNATQTDASCEDKTDPSTCRVFNGEYKYCSWETTGLGTDCCEQPKGLDILAYMQAAYNMTKLAQMAGTGAFGTTAQGAYKTVSEPITNAGQAVADWAKGAYTSATESLVGNAAGEVATEGGTTLIGSTVDAISAAIAQLQQEVYKFVYDMLPQDLAKMLFTSTTSSGATTLAISDGVTNAVSGVMAVYTAYTMAKLALTLLTACDDVEMDMGVRLAQRTCFKVGDSYCAKKYPIIGTCMQERQDHCCYSSILSRIIMKESYDQLAINPLTGTPETSCQGLTVEQLGQVDFAKPSMKSALQEWVGLLADSGLMKSKADEASLTGGAVTAELSCQEVEVPVIDPSTGAQVRDEKGAVLYRKTGEKECFKGVAGGQIFNAKERDTVGTRTSEAIDGAQDRVQESRDNMRERANDLDCSVYPRPPVCDMGFDPRLGSNGN